MRYINPHYITLHYITLHIKGGGRIVSQSFVVFCCRWVRHCLHCSVSIALLARLNVAVHGSGLGEEHLQAEAPRAGLMRRRRRSCVNELGVGTDLLLNTSRCGHLHVR